MAKLKVESFEEHALKQTSKYSKTTEDYCYYRILRAMRARGKREYELFWLNMHYLYFMARPKG